MLAACSGDGGGARQTGSDERLGEYDRHRRIPPARPVRPARTTTTASLSISGAPNRQVIANQPYWFRPVANEPDGAALRFGIANQPHWSTFNPTTGEVTGTPVVLPTSALYRGVTVTVTAGTQMRALSFDVEVVQVGTNSVTISWTPPTENNDGTPLVNLAGYRIRYGQQSGNCITPWSISPIPVSQPM